MRVDSLGPTSLSPSTPDWVKTRLGEAVPKAGKGDLECLARNRRCSTSEFKIEQRPLAESRWMK